MEIIKNLVSLKSYKFAMVALIFENYVGTTIITPYHMRNKNILRHCNDDESLLAYC